MVDGEGGMGKREEKGEWTMDYGAMRIYTY
jgi:hypothetical protein